jgi:tetratricopeptide (TPR) repeat protein
VSAAVLDEARRFLAEGRNGEAVTLLERTISQGGGPAMHVMLGYAYYHGERIADARAALNRGVDLFPFDVGLQEALARIRWASGDGEAYITRFIDALGQRPRDVALRFRCAELLRQSGDTTRCEQLLRDGLQLDPGHPTLSATLGVLLDETGQLDEALALNIAVVRAYNGAPIAQLSVAHTLMRLGRADEALRLLTPLRKREPGLQLAITYEAMALKQVGDPRHDWLCDYQRHVQPYQLGVPAGFSSLADFNAELGLLLRSLMDAPDHPLDQSLRGGSQTSTNLIFKDAPLLRAYFEALDAPIRAYIDAMGDDPEHPLGSRKSNRHQLSGCWSVALRPGGFHVNHTHPQGWISSSYYVSLPASVNADSQEGWIKFGEPRWPIPGCGVERVIQPREGLLVLFPSYMWHGTIPFSSGERLTAPFDVVPVQE